MTSAGVNDMDYTKKQRVVLPHGSNAVAIPVDIGFNIGPDGPAVPGDPIGPDGQPQHADIGFVVALG